MRQTSRQIKSIRLIPGRCRPPTKGVNRTGVQGGQVGANGRAGAGSRCPGERVAKGREIEETAEPDPCDR
jgi:hypothetical protein